ncbi:unnamed protein product [Anisakis simplex]|uniref:Uncharacterized protein n=1 Tax=Anisakis simplex TaxID=6269 RepID=A0A3P6RW93_ANISI|nr:unnamed protein product [Anisakis simplex]
MLDAPSASGSGSGRAPVPPAAPPVITLDDEVEEIPVAVERKHAKPAAAPNRDSPRHRKRELGAAPSQKSSKRTRESGAEHQAKMLRYSQILDKYRRKMEQLQRKRPRSQLAEKGLKRKRHERGGAGGARSSPFARLNRQCGSLLEGAVLGEANTQLIAQLAAETTPTELDELNQNLKRISRVVERIRDWWAEQGAAAAGSSGWCPEGGQHSPGSASDTGTGRTGNSSTGTAKTGSQKGGERNGTTRMEEEEETVYERSEGSGEESGVEGDREEQVGLTGKRRAKVAAGGSDQPRVASRTDSTGPEAISIDQRAGSPGSGVQSSGKASSGEVTPGSGQPEQSHSGIETNSFAKGGVAVGSDDVTSERGDNGMEASASARLSKSHAHRGRSHRKRSVSEQVICGDDGQDVFEKEGETTRMKAAGTSKSCHSDGRRSHSPARGKDRDDSPKTEDSDEF